MALYVHLNKKMTVRIDCLAPQTLKYIHTFSRNDFVVGDGMSKKCCWSASLGLDSVATNTEQSANNGQNGFLSYMRYTVQNRIL